MLRLRYRLTLLLIVGIVCAFSTIPVHAAAPRLAMIYGAPLRHPVILDVWQEQVDLVGGDMAGLIREDLDGRPYLDVALFWGPEWSEFVESGKPLGELRPEQANQSGRFYPAVGDAGPVIMLGQFEDPQSSVGQIRKIRAEALQVLARHGIPTRLDTLPNTGSTFIPISLPLLSLGMAFILLGVAQTCR